MFTSHLITLFQTKNKKRPLKCINKQKKKITFLNFFFFFYHTDAWTETNFIILFKNVRLARSETKCTLNTQIPWLNFGVYANSKLPGQSNDKINPKQRNVKLWLIGCDLVRIWSHGDFSRIFEKEIGIRNYDRPQLFNQILKYLNR